MFLFVVVCCFLLSYVVWFFHMNYHELPINSLCSEIHDQLHGNYMFFRCRMLSFVVLCCLIFIFHVNYHELSINSLCSEIHDQLYGNYMLKNYLCRLVGNSSEWCTRPPASDNFGHQFPVLSQFRPFVATRKEEMAANISMAWNLALSLQCQKKTNFLIRYKLGLVIRF